MTDKTTFSNSNGGSEAAELTILTRDTRKELIVQAQEEALRMGANAIIG